MTSTPRADEMVDELRELQAYRTDMIATLSSPCVPVGELRTWLRAVAELAESPEADPVAFMELTGMGAKGWFDRLAALASSPTDPCAAMREALTNAREAIAASPRDAFGWGTVAPKHDGDTGYQYPLRDELLAEIDAALNLQPGEKVS